MILLATPFMAFAEQSKNGSKPHPPITLQKGHKGVYIKFPKAPDRQSITCAYDGKVLYCIAPQTGSTQEHFDNNLKNIGWNDKISSITWILVTDYRQFIDDNPDAEHPDC